MAIKDFLGTEFRWFVGVVEGRQDPQYAGRVQVRCLGYHTSDKAKLPTADLPWASVMHPTISSGISGLGYSPSFMVEGTWVFGYFRDTEFQDPVVMFTMPGKPTELAGDTGFYDPNKVYPKYKDEPDTNRLAVGLSTSPHLSLELRKAVRIIGIPTADFNETGAADSSIIEASDGDTFDQPEIPAKPVYPFNHVYESESGHIMEYDDTADNERIHQRHRTGTSYEIDKDGSQVEIIKNDHYTFVSGKRQAQITGKSDLTIGGRHKLFINKDGQTNNHYDIQIGPNANINIQVDKGNINLVTVDGKINVNSGGDYNVKVGGNYTINVAGNKAETIEGTKTSNTTGAVIHRGARIDLNP